MCLFVPYAVILIGYVKEYSIQIEQLVILEFEAVSCKSILADVNEDFVLSFMVLIPS